VRRRQSIPPRSAPELAPQQRAHSGKQLREARGRGQIIVGACIQPTRAVLDGIVSGQHEPRLGETVLAQIVQHLKAVPLGKPDVQDYQIDLLSGGLAVAVLAHSSRDYAVTLLSQATLEAVQMLL